MTKVDCKSLLWFLRILGAAAILLTLTPRSYAIPAFARQYQTSCSTCHVNFPKLNDFGKAFKDAGFKFPKEDEIFIKIPPLMLGAEGPQINFRVAATDLR